MVLADSGSLSEALTCRTVRRISNSPRKPPTNLAVIDSKETFRVRHEESGQDKGPRRQRSRGDEGFLGLRQSGHGRRIDFEQEQRADGACGRFYDAMPLLH